MNKSVPWSIKGVGFDARELAKDAARRSGMTLGEWLHSVIADRAYETGTDIEDIDEEDQLEAVTARLTRLSEGQGDHRPVRRKAPAAPRRAPREASYQTEPDFGDLDDDLPLRRRQDMRRIAAGLETPLPRKKTRASAPPVEHILDEAVQIFETRHREHAERTTDALTKVAMRIAELESHISERADSEPLRAAVSSLEERVEQLVHREQTPGKVEKALTEIEAQIARLAERLPTETPAPAPAKEAAQPEHLRRIEDKLNKLIGSLEGPSEVVFPARRDGSHFPGSDAVSEIKRRQRTLDEGSALAAITGAEAATRPSARDAFTTPVFGARASRGRPADVERSLQAGLAAVTEQLADLRRDGARRDGRVKSERGRVSHPDLDFLRHQLAEISRAVMQLGERSRTESLETALQDLSRKIDESRQNGVEAQALAPIERVLADIRQSIAVSAPDPVSRQIQEELRHLHAKIDAMSMTGFDRIAFAKLKQQTDGIAQTLSDMLSRPMPIEGLERQVALLTERVDQLANRRDIVSSYLVETLDTIRTSVDRLESSPALRHLEDRVNELAARSDQVPAYLVDTLDDLRHAIDSVASNPALRAVQNQVSEIAAKSGNLPDELIETLTDLRHSIEKVSGNPTLRALEAQVADLAAHSGHLPDHLGEALSDIRLSIQRMADNVGFRVEAPAMPAARFELPVALTDTLEEMRHSIDRMSTQTGLHGIETQVAQLARKLDDAIAQPPTESRETKQIYDRLSDLHEAMLQRLDTSPAVAASHFEDRLADLTNRIEDVHDAVIKQRETAQAPAARDPRLEEMVAQLAERIEHVTGGQADTRALQALENQVMRLAERLERTGETADAITALERSISELFSQVEETRHAAVDAAESAAREAVRGVVQAPAGATAAPEIVVRELSDLRNLQDESDRRTHSTLTAVHETLEKVVDRLALLEDDLTDLRTKDKEQPLAAGPAPVFEPAKPSRAAPSQDIHIEPRHDPVTPAQAPARVDARAVLGAADRRPPEAESAAPGLDDLIEPGSGFAPARRSPDAELHLNDLSASLSPEPTGARASFIAAARRAAQSTSGPAVDEAPQRKAASRKGGSEALDDARAKARAAASSLDEPQRASAVNGAAQLIRSKAKPILLSLAGLVLLIGALQVARSLTDTTPGDVAPVEALPKLSQAPDRVSPAAQLAQLPLPITAPQQPIPGSDPVVTGSIAKAPGTAFPSATAPAPASTQSLVELAGTGNMAAQYELASRYLDGRDVPRDPAQATEWFRKAAANGSAPAQYRLGAIYEKGNGVPRSAKEAAVWYRKAADAGNVRAMHNLAVLIADGLDGKPDYGLAADWFRKAAEFGVRDSQYNLAILYARGLGVEADLVKAYLWLALAANNGDADAGKKRDDVAARLQPRQLAEAKVAVDTFVLRTPDPSANETAAPVVSNNVMPRAPEKTARPAQSNAGSKTTARVSSL